MTPSMKTRLAARPQFQTTDTLGPMKRLCGVGFALGVVVTLFLAGDVGAANVNAGTGYTNDFSSQPAATDWSTRTIGTSSAASAITTADGLDAVVQTNAAAGITTLCTSSTASPPTSGTLATWSSTGGYLQTRPSGNAATVLMV